MDSDLVPVDRQDGDVDLWRTSTRAGGQRPHPPPAGGDGGTKVIQKGDDLAVRGNGVKIHCKRLLSRNTEIFYAVDLAVTIKKPESNVPWDSGGCQGRGDFSPAVFSMWITATARAPNCLAFLSAK